MEMFHALGGPLSMLMQCTERMPAHAKEKVYTALSNWIYIRRIEVQLIAYNDVLQLPTS